MSCGPDPVGYSAEDEAMVAALKDADSRIMNANLRHFNPDSRHSHAN